MTEYFSDGTEFYCHSGNAILKFDGDGWFPLSSNLKLLVKMVPWLAVVSPSEVPSLYKKPKSGVQKSALQRILKAFVPSMNTQGDVLPEVPPPPYTSIVSLPGFTPDVSARIQKSNPYHDELGRFSTKVNFAHSSNGFTSSEMNWMKEAKKRQKDFEKDPKNLGLRFDFEKDAPKVPEGYIRKHLKIMARLGSPMDKTLLEHGEGFKVPTEPPQIPLGKMKQCFQNATHMVWDSSDYDYAEGYIFPSGLIPIHHAWVVNKKTNEVVDPTLGWLPSAEYFGVKLTKEQLNIQLQKNMVYGVFVGPKGNPTDLALGVEPSFEYKKP